jgi:hypothetical protein
METHNRPNAGWKPPTENTLMDGCSVSLIHAERRTLEEIEQSAHRFRDLHVILVTIPFHF